MPDSLPHSPLNEEIAAILRSHAARLRPMPTQAALASVAGVSQSHMSALLSGQKSFDIDQLEAVSYSLGIDIDELLTDATRAVRESGWTPDVLDFTVGGVVETANKATKRAPKKKDLPAD